MAGQPVVFDIETQNSFRDVNNNTKKLKVSVAVAFDYKTEQVSAYREDNLSGLFNLFERSSIIIGFNSNNFDLVVLNEYYVGDLFKLPHYDLLEDVKNKTGKRYPLDDLIRATLGKGKTGHGLQAIDYFREGRLEELTKYCTDDVLLTRELFDFGVKNNFIYAPTVSNKMKIEVDWRKVLDDKTEAVNNLTFSF